MICKEDVFVRAAMVVMVDGRGLVEVAEGVESEWGKRMSAAHKHTTSPPGQQETQPSTN